MCIVSKVWERPSVYISKFANQLEWSIKLGMMIVLLCFEPKKTCEANPAGENSSFIFTVCVKSVPLYHFKLAYIVLHMVVKEFLETHFWKWRKWPFYSVFTCRVVFNFLKFHSFIPSNLKSACQISFWLSSTGGAGGAPWGILPPWKLLPLPEIWSQNNSITKEICITIDFASPRKKFLEESQHLHLTATA